MSLPDSSELGLVGGVIAIIVGILAAVFVFTISGSGMIWVGGGLLSVSLVVTGLSAIAKARADAPPDVAALPDEYLIPKLAEADLPFGVCVRCRQVDEPAAFHGRCPRCDAGADYLLVESDDERKLARSSLGIPG